MKNNYLLVHGSFSSPFSNWIPYLRSELENKDLEVYTPDLPSGVGKQNYENWSKLMNVYVDANILNENTVIFAHSIAPVFICKYLIENKIKVKRLVLVCGFNNYLGIDSDYDAVNVSLFLDNISDIKNYCDDIICLYSDNDPYVRYDIEKEFADAITDNQIMISGGGHLNSESGYTEFTELLKYI
ncbi:MAG: alpha/beta hydrolase [Erysipelotrichales bacterium]|nr:alpha/beta hydrolase [Erysipelotrichales bacterium]